MTTTDWQARYFEAEARQTESNGMLTAENERLKRLHNDAFHEAERWKEREAEVRAYAEETRRAGVWALNLVTDWVPASAYEPEEYNRALAALADQRGCIETGAGAALSPEPQTVGTIRDLIREIRELVGLFDPYGRGRIDEPESHCADQIARATELADAVEKQLLDGCVHEICKDMPTGVRSSHPALASAGDASEGISSGSLSGEAAPPSDQHAATPFHQVGKSEAYRCHYGWWDHFNEEWVRTSEAAEKLIAGGNKLSKLYIDDDPRHAINR